MDLRPGAHQAVAGEALRLLGQMHWSSRAGIYLTGEYLHLLAAPVAAEPDQRCTVVISIRPRRPDVQVPAGLTLLLQSDSEPGLLHYGRFNRLGQVQLVAVRPGPLRVRGALSDGVAVPAALQPALGPGWRWQAEARASASASDHHASVAWPHLQHATGDLRTQIHATADGIQVLITAQQGDWADRLLVVGWEIPNPDGQTQLQTALIPMGWYPALGVWGGQIGIPQPTLAQFWPPQEAIMSTVLAEVPPELIRASLAAAASSITQQAWYRLAERSDLPAALRSLIRSFWPST